MRLKPPPIIYFTGLDGSGKTTFVNMLAEEFRRQGVPVKVAWLRMSHYLSKPLLLFCRIVGLTEYEEIDGVHVGYHHFYRSKVVSWLYILLRGIDTWFDALFRVYLPARVLRKTVICDRYVLDAIIDLMVDTHVNLERTIIWKSLSALIPHGTVVFFIERDDRFVRNCRPEMVREEVFLQRKRLYMSVFKNRAIRVDNDSTIENAFNLILEQLNEAKT